MAIAELMPISSPLLLVSGPPEFPGLIGASVWIASRTALLSWTFVSPVRTGRCMALTIPDVTVPLRPSGLPTATTSSPTASASELPKAVARSPVASIFTTARSEVGSVPMILALNSLPSWVVTCSEPPCAASDTTWLLVRM